MSCPSGAVSADARKTAVRPHAGAHARQSSPAIAATTAAGRRLYVGRRYDSRARHARSTDDSPACRAARSVRGRRAADLPLLRLIDGTTAAWADVGKFRASGLRVLPARTPYLHNSTAANVEQVVDFSYQRFNLMLSALERADLVAFLVARRALSRRDALSAHSSQPRRPEALAVTAGYCLRMATAPTHRSCSDRTNCAAPGGNSEDDFTILPAVLHTLVAVRRAWSSSVSTRAVWNPQPCLQVANEYISRSQPK
jgi:hypothetical protein